MLYIFVLPFVRWQLSGVRCQVLRVTYHMSIMPTATATDPPPDNSPNIQSIMLLLILTKTHQQEVAAIIDPF